MKYKNLFLLLIPVLLFSCQKDYNNYPSPASPADPVPAVLLKEITIPNLPSPYYHFDYDPNGKATFVSFASGFTMYNISYTGGKISEMRNNIVINKDRLQYFYENEGRVTTLRYADSTGEVYARVNFVYDGQKLKKLIREKKSGTAFIVDKTMEMLYYADGNLRQVTDHRQPLNASPEQTFIDRYEQYDNKINTDAFGLLHTEFFDHLVLLPGVQLQKNNPGKLTHTGDDTQYQITYTYTYNDKGAPLAKMGTGTWLNGPNAGQTFPSTSLFSYY